jgi:catechol 2,3-dioxygenase-like lactoylglutathione lyase family enzyme
VPTPCRTPPAAPAAIRARSLPSLGLLTALLLALPAAAAATATAVDAVAINVSDLDRAAAFYTGVLAFEKVSEIEVAGDAVERLQGVFGVRLRAARLRLGDETIELREYLAPRGRPVPADTRSNDRWFQHIAIIVRDMDAAYRVLREHDVEHASPGPQRLPDWNPAAGGIEAFYFRDPDGHPLEILEFPPGKGDPRWGRPTGRLFLGIDHTAIVVEDTDESLRFYRDLLGMTVAGASENYGPEQERLNNVFGARLRITALRAESGPGVELLEYLAPRDGRPAPLDQRANDLASTETVVRVGNAGGAAGILEAAGIRWVSPGAVETPGRELGYDEALLVRDPDGHFVRLIEVP